MAIPATERTAHCPTVRQRAVGHPPQDRRSSPLGVSRAKHRPAKDLPHPSRLQQLGRQRNAGGLRAALHPAPLSQMERGAGRQHCVRRHLVSGAGGDWWRDRVELWFFQRAVGDPGGRADHLFDRPADQLLRCQVRPGHGLADPRRRLWLPRQHADLAGLCQLHFHLLRAGGGDPGVGAANGAGLATAAVLSNRLAGRGAAGDVRHHADLAVAALVAADLDGAVHPALRLCRLERAAAFCRVQHAGGPGVGQLGL